MAFIHFQPIPCNDNANGMEKTRWIVMEYYRIQNIQMKNGSEDWTNEEIEYFNGIQEKVKSMEYK